ncbi:MAG: hypothetical protein M1812_008614, partial [Candelaria pacifica]
MPNYSPDTLSYEFDIICKALNANAHLSDRKIEFIKAFRATTGYGLLDSKNFVESFLGKSYIPIWDYLQTKVVDFPDRVKANYSTPTPANPPVPQFYLVISESRVEYTAHSLAEAKRVVELLTGLDRYDVKIFAEV